MTAQEVERYARHIVLREIGGPGQARLRRARIAVVGAGGLGAPALLYLAAAGVGALRLIDDDTVTLSNLQRQVIFDANDLGQRKVAAAGARLGRLNEHVALDLRPERLTAENARALLGEVDLILDGSDSFATRRAVNAAAVALSRPLLSGAIGQWEGQVSLFHPAGGHPCYHCLFPHDPAEGLAPSCAEAGVIGALPGVVGATMALEAIKHLAGVGHGLGGRLWLYDALEAQTRVIAIERRAGCEVCGSA